MIFPEYLFKVCLVADKDVGTTSLSKYIDPSCWESYINTLGVDLLKKKINTFGILSNHMVWVISPNLIFFNLFKLYLSGANGIILMYDITNANSLNYLSKVVQHVKKLLEKGNLPFLLVGNKSDLKKNRNLSKEQVKKFKIENNITKSMEISIKTGENIEKMFTRLTRMAIKKITSRPRPRIIQTPYRREYTPVKSPKSSKRFKYKKDNTLGWILVLLMIGLTIIGIFPGLIVLLGFIIIFIIYYSLRRL